MEPKGFRVMITGHRPDKLFGYDIDSAEYIPIRNWIATILAELKEEHKEISCISGMALGADTIFAEEALKLNLPLFAFIPYKEQAKPWRQPSRDHWKDLLSKAASIHVSTDQTITDKWNASKFLLKRNEDMLLRSDLILAIWNGDSDGGTAFTVRKALAMKKVVRIFDPITGKEN